MKAYKVFNSDWTCQGYKYKVGRIYKMEDSPVLCKRGFHACKNAIDCFNYYKFDSKNKVAEVELVGNIVGEGDKQATNKIKIVREISWQELLRLVNIGKNNTGHHNSGNSNTGYYNSGNHNSGYYNSGHYNSGDGNSGNGNSGHYNSGNSNSGHYNSGNRNSGNSNSGDWNSGNRNSGNSNSGYSNSGHWNSGNRNSGHYNSGYHNSGYSNSGHYNSGDGNSGNYNSGDWNSGDWNNLTPEKIYFFNKLITMKEYKQIKMGTAYEILKEFRLIKYRIRRITGKYGDYKYLSYKRSFRYFWRNLTARERKIIMDMPYFDRDIFREITGV